MQNSPLPDAQAEDTGAGESTHTAANAASSQADATGTMTPDELVEGPSRGAGQSTMAEADEQSSSREKDNPA